MRFLLVNPPWKFDQSIYFGCREPHLPLELMYSKSLLERSGHQALIVDGQLEQLELAEIRTKAEEFAPDLVVITTAPSYLFWRCAPPELRIPMETAEVLRGIGKLVVIGPHASTTPRRTLQKLQADIAVMGECEEILPRLAGELSDVPSICYFDNGTYRSRGGPHASDMSALPALEWDAGLIRKHTHHHHRFDREPGGPGAEMETSRGCPYHCTFCAKDNFRNEFRRRPIQTIDAELTALIEAGTEYVYFIDEIFLPYRGVLELIASKRIAFGIQTRIDLWNRDMIDLLGEAGCVSIEAGVESITAAGRARLDKKCKISTEDMSERLIHAKKRVPFVQANLLDCREDDPADVAAWREHLQENGVWANEPVPMFTYPGSPDYTHRWGAADDEAWERAHADYLRQFSKFSDIQEASPAPLVQLEALKR